MRMYRDRINEHGDTKVAARRHVGALIDVNPDTLRNWIDREGSDTGTAAESSAAASAAELKALRKENDELRRANDSQNRERVFRRGGGRPPTAVIVDYRSRFGVDPIWAVLTEHTVRRNPADSWPTIPATERVTVAPSCPCSFLRAYRRTSTPRTSPLGAGSNPSAHPISAERYSHDHDKPLRPPGTVVRLRDASAAPTSGPSSGSFHGCHTVLSLRVRLEFPATKQRGSQDGGVRIVRLADRGP
ncbi:hypothetical protein HYG77_37135 (plasmid) [Rhodococcus sp. ZPP]|nr:hypothetical protein HYG77_37135 [Rhodococcus sp. ZPP]